MTLGNTVIIPDRLVAGQFVHDVEDARVGEAKVALERAHVRGDVVDLLVALAADQDAVTPAVVHVDGGFLVGAEQAEGGEEHVQQPGVVRVLDVLLHQLPVAGDVLPIVAEHLQGPAAVDSGVVGPKLLAEILAERRGRVAEGRPNEAVDDLHPQAAEAVVGRVEVGRHAALPPDTAAERDALKVAAEVVGPLVVGTEQVLGVSGPRLAELDAAMGAAVLDDADLVGAAAGDDDGAFAEGGGLEVADFGYFGFEGAEQPMRAVPDAFELGGVDVGVGVDPEGHAARAGFGPDAGDGAHGRRVLRRWFCRECAREGVEAQG